MWKEENRANIYLGQKNVATNLSAIQLPEMFKVQKKKIFKAKPLRFFL